MSARHVRLLFKPFLAKPVLPDCQKCQVSCQSACKTSLTVGNQACTAPEKQKDSDAG
ncbi:MAG: six-cysteine peptide SCIFF [Clostridia bacterium]|nr:six-cysteine peptide SCIFF [Clostridia bacterium]MBC7348178.1 six-cysteine peptide SCIFF [Clostridia bacterium]